MATTKLAGFLVSELKHYNDKIQIHQNMRNTAFRLLKMICRKNLHVKVKRTPTF